MTKNKTVETTCNVVDFINLIENENNKNTISIYLSSNFDKREELLEKFGKHKTTKACIYINKLSDINIEVFKEMITASINQTRNSNQGC